jgi:hypothetical protein
MQNLTYPELFEYIAKTIIEPFHALHSVLKRKNPYLFKAKNITTAQDLVTEILQAHLSSQEETLFGTYLEGPAVEVCRREYGGSKSSAAGIDLELERDGKGTSLQSSLGRTGATPAR